MVKTFKVEAIKSETSNKNNNLKNETRKSCNSNLTIWKQKTLNLLNTIES